MSVATSWACSRTGASSGIRCFARTPSIRIRSSSRVYADLVYHQGGGFRRTAGGRVARVAMQEELAATWRGRLAARLPTHGPLGALRRLVYPLRRHRRALAAELAQVNEQVYELIRRDEEFYVQLLDPARGGELAELASRSR